MIHLLGPHPIVLMGTEQLLATYSENFKTFSSNTDNLGYVLDHLSHVPISGMMVVGTAGIAGMFMGQSIRTSKSASLIAPNNTHNFLNTLPIELSKSLLTPLTLFPSSWQLDPTSLLLQGGIPEETLLLVLAEKYLNLKLTDSPSEVNFALTLLFH